MSRFDSFGDFLLVKRSILINMMIFRNLRSAYFFNILFSVIWWFSNGLYIHSYIYVLKNTCATKQESS